MKKSYSFQTKLKTKLNFPHIYRLFSARHNFHAEKILSKSCALFISFIFIFNLSSNLNINKTSKLKIQAILKNEEAHKKEKLIKNLIQEKQYILAQQINDDAMKTFSNNLSLMKLNDIIYQSSNIDKIIDLKLKRWKIIKEKYPDYRDAYVKLATIFNQKGDRDEVIKNIKMAEKINPNWQPLQNQAIRSLLK